MADQIYTMNVKLINTLGEEFIIASDNIISLSITESVLSVLPKFQMVVSDKGTLIENRAITDKSMFYIVINNGISDEPLIDANFIISSFDVSSDSLENQFVSISIAGYIEANDMFSTYYNRSYRGSSDSVIGNIANLVGMTMDARTQGVENNVWYQKGNNFQFIHHVSDRSFIDSDGVFVYGDINRNLIYTSYKTEVDRESKFIAYYSKDRVENNILLNNEQQYMFFNGYNILNNAEMYNNCVLYGGTYSYYNLEEYIYTTVGLDSKNTDFYNQNQNHIGNPVFGIGVGLLPDEGIFDTIYKGKIQNAFYKYAMFSVSILMNINNSTDVKLFDKVDFNQPSTILRDLTADPYSGEYLVGSITYSIIRNRPIEKQIIICRYGLNSNPEDKSVRDIE